MEQSFYGEHALAYPNHKFKTCGGPEAFTSTTVFDKCGGRTSCGRAGRLHREDSLRVSLPILLMRI